MSSTGSKTNQRNRSIVDIKLLAIVWALKHSKYYTVANPNVHVTTNHFPLLGRVKMSLTEIDNIHIVKLLERVYNYSLAFSHT